MAATKPDPRMAVSLSAEGLVTKVKIGLLQHFLPSIGLLIAIIPVTTTTAVMGTHLFKPKFRLMVSSKHGRKIHNTFEQFRL